MPQENIIPNIRKCFWRQATTTSLHQQILLIWTLYTFTDLLLKKKSVLGKNIEHASQAIMSNMHIRLNV